MTWRLPKNQIIAPDIAATRGTTVKMRAKGKFCLSEHLNPSKPSSHFFFVQRCWVSRIQLNGTCICMALHLRPLETEISALLNLSKKASFKDSDIYFSTDEEDRMNCKTVAIDDN